MRLLEGLRLRVKDVDFEMRQVTVRDGKGAKDRVATFGLGGAVTGLFLTSDAICHYR